MVAGALCAGILALTSGSDARAPVTSNKVEIKRQLAERLHQELLAPSWIACVPSGRRYRGARVIRCNVNFGDPHIEAYCSVLRGNRLVTNKDDPSIPCGHDDKGWRAPIRTFDN
jgi:hypothetical protein